MYEGMGKPKVGDYVVIKIKISIWLPDEIKDILENNIGLVISYDSKVKNQAYKIEFLEFHEVLDNAFTKSFEDKNWVIDISEILFWSRDKEKCEEYLTLKDDINKYNI